MNLIECFDEIINHVESNKRQYPKMNSEEVYKILTTLKAKALQENEQKTITLCPECGNTPEVITCCKNPVCTHRKCE